MSYFAVALVSAPLLMVCCGVLLKKNRQGCGYRESFHDLKTRDRWDVALACAVVICIIFAAWLSVKQEWYVSQQIRVTLLLSGLALVTVTDLLNKIIPNEAIIALLAAQAVLLAAEILWQPYLLYPLFMDALGGLAIAGAIMLTCMLITRGSLGAGDVKLFAVIGAYVGAYQIISVMFFAVLTSALCGILLLAMRRVKLRDTIPMAPFAFMGTLIHLFFLSR